MSAVVHIAAASRRAATTVSAANLFKCEIHVFLSLFMCKSQHTKLACLVADFRPKGTTPTNPTTPSFQVEMVLLSHRGVGGWRVLGFWQLFPNSGYGWGAEARRFQDARYKQCQNLSVARGQQKPAEKSFRGLFPNSGHAWGLQFPRPVNHRRL